MGSGTAGAMAAAYIKSAWGDRVHVTQVYDHSRPCIGVGESTTPFIFNFLNKVGITFEDLVKGTASTVKLGIKFKNWLGDGGHYYHNFLSPRAEETEFSTRFAAMVATGDDVNAMAFDPWLTENRRVPHSAYAGDASFAVHLDSQEFSRFVENFMGDRVEVIDGVVERVIVAGGEISSLLLSDGRTIEGDFYVDASGMARTLIGELDADWADRSDVLPVDTAIPNPVPHDRSSLEPYTLAEATQNGWIWQVPLSHRYGTGYVYSSRFTTESEAEEEFSSWLMANHGVPLTSDRRIRFQCGYFKKAWSGNCLAVGLASGFVEPLESTSIHITNLQIREFCVRYTLRNFKFDRDTYNRYLSDVWEDTVDFIRFHYHTGRRDTPFWRHINETTPEWIGDLCEKLSGDVIHGHYYKHTRTIFSELNWNPVAHGLGLCDREGAERFLKLRGLWDEALADYYHTAAYVKMDREISKGHLLYLDYLKRRW